MKRRTTIEIDEALLARAQEALGCRTMRATVEEALRRAAEIAEDERVRLAEAQREYFRRVDAHIDLDVLRSDEMWQ
jgi:Arc/MetJ family transcription regulator